MPNEIHVGVTQQPQRTVTVGVTQRTPAAVSVGQRVVQGPPGPVGPQGPPGDVTLAIHTGDTPPDDTSLLWLDTSQAP